MNGSNTKAGDNIELMSQTYTIDQRLTFEHTKALRNLNSQKNLIIGLSRFSLVIAFQDKNKIRSDGERQTLKEAAENVEKYVKKLREEEKKISYKHR